MATVRVSTGNPVIFLSGEIDMATVDGVVSAFEPCVQAGGPVILDMSSVTFMDSTGLHALVMASQALGERGCIIVHGAHGAVLHVLRLTLLRQAIENLHFIECTILVEAA